MQAISRDRLGAPEVLASVSLRTPTPGIGEVLDGVEHPLGPLDVLVNNAGIMNAGPIDTEDEALTARAVAMADDILRHIDPEQRAAYVERVKASA